MSYYDFLEENLQQQADKEAIIINEFQRESLVRKMTLELGSFPCY
jgi:hypothetical protein